jgi:hypothetical protein
MGKIFAAPIILIVNWKEAGKRANFQDMETTQTRKL